MAYQELIKNFEKIRHFMMEFYVYGFKSREQYDLKSLRSYDNEKRRIESYLHEYMGFHQSNNGKNVFISIDSRNISHNPLYQAFLSKSFTPIDITLHFILLDILYSPSIHLSLNEIIDIIDKEYLPNFNNPIVIDSSTIRKKLKEYIDLGIFSSYKEKKTMYYQRNESIDLTDYEDVFHFFSEYSLLGIIGYYLNHHDNQVFSFKHHYILHCLDSEILYQAFIAIREKKKINIEYKDRSFTIAPLKIFVSTQNGRRYLFGYRYDTKCIKSFRLDHIDKIKLKEQCDNYDSYLLKLEELRKYMWGVAYSSKIEHVEFVLEIKEKEKWIYHRLMREKRIGKVEKLDDTHYCFKADVYDSFELVPWIRTFIGRITSMNFSNRTVENIFKSDLHKMYEMYEVE